MSVRFLFVTTDFHPDLLLGADWRAGSVAEGLALLVAPSCGRVDAVRGGGEVRPGEVVALVRGGAGRADPVSAPVALHLEGLLVRDGQTVRTGQAVAWARTVGDGAR